MISFLNTKFKNLTYKRFLVIATITLFSADILNLLYINKFWFETRFTLDFLKQVLALKGINPSQIPILDLQNYRFMLIGSLSNVLVLFMGIHSIVYYFFYRQKKWTLKYIGGYCLSATLLTILELIFFRENFVSWSITLPITALMYLFVFLGIKTFKRLESQT